MAQYRNAVELRAAALEAIRLGQMLPWKLDALKAWRLILDDPDHLDEHKVIDGLVFAHREGEDPLKHGQWAYFFSYNPDTKEITTGPEDGSRVFAEAQFPSDGLIERFPVGT